MVIDTNIFIEYLRAGDKKKTTLYRIPVTATISISSVTIFELSIGATTQQKRDEVALLTSGITLLPFDEIAADKAAQIYLALKKANQLIEFRDIFIAATAIVNQLPLATLNRKHFARIDALVLQKI